MIELTRWFERTWTFDLPLGAFSAVVERVRGTPARAAELIRGWPDDLLARSPAGAWSAKRNLGHLDDLHDLDIRRLEDFLRGEPELSAADLGNRRTLMADHDRIPADEIVRRFRERREALVARLEALTEREVGITSLHPRLQIPMRLIDWLQFVADHDDHHLARARETLRRASSGRS